MSADFTMYQGDDKRIEITVQDGSGNIVDISDMTEIRWQLAKAPNRVPLVQKVLGDGVEMISGPFGRFDVVLVGSDTEAMRKGSYYHESELIDATGEVATILSGTVTMLGTLIKPETSP